MLPAISGRDPGDETGESVAALSSLSLCGNQKGEVKMAKQQPYFIEPLAETNPYARGRNGNLYKFGIFRSNGDVEPVFRFPSKRAAEPVLSNLLSGRR